MGEEKRKDEAKKKAFEERPDDFFDSSECLLVIKRSEDGVLQIMNRITKVQDIIEAKYHVDRQLNMRDFEIRATAAKNPTILKAQNIIPISR